MTGTSLIDRSLESALGGQSGLPLLLTANWVGIGISSRFLVYIGMPLLTPSTSGRWTLSRTAWRRRRVGSLSLMASCWRPETIYQCVSGHRRGSDGSRWLLGISRTTGGQPAHGMREVAAASGGSAPTSNAKSGNAACLEGSERGLYSLSQRYWPQS